ncbi:GNAT family N-acetyltransferase [Streptomyces sp. NPDC060194]|uniref:GNAT family N-acetyltransferase n=1 Tax=Streptomyces sp. NPDC060194 TaxID=3347069 RepID=UPI003650C82C
MTTDVRNAHFPAAPPTTGDAARGEAPPLDNPAWAALSGAHRHLGEHAGAAARYAADVSPFAAVADPADPRSWADLARLVGLGGQAVLTGFTDAALVPDGWRFVENLPGVQLVADGLDSAADPEAVRLTPDDVPEMLDLVRRTQPGPFLPRTIEMGAYWGLRRGGRLVAMAGERLSLPGHTELSAVCTDPDHRGEGLAARLVRHVAQGVRDRGEMPFLHAAARNEPAIRLYLALGFTLRRRPLFAVVQAPGGDATAA